MLQCSRLHLSSIEFATAAYSKWLKESFLLYRKANVLALGACLGLHVPSPCGIWRSTHSVPGTKDQPESGCSRKRDCARTLLSNHYPSKSGCWLHHDNMVHSWLPHSVRCKRFHPSNCNLKGLYLATSENCHGQGVKCLLHARAAWFYTYMYTIYVVYMYTIYIHILPCMSFNIHTHFPCLSFKLQIESRKLIQWAASRQCTRGDLLVTFEISCFFAFYLCFLCWIPMRTKAKPLIGGAWKTAEQVVLCSYQKGAEIFWSGPLSMLSFRSCFSCPMLSVFRSIYFRRLISWEHRVSRISHHWLQME